MIILCSNVLTLSFPSKVFPIPSNQTEIVTYTELHSDFFLSPRFMQDIQLYYVPSFSLFHTLIDISNFINSIEIVTYAELHSDFFLSPRFMQDLFLTNTGDSSSPILSFNKFWNIFSSQNTAVLTFPTFVICQNLRFFQLEFF